MKLPFKKMQAINDLANLLYDFLPGNPHPYADPKISFKGIAHDLNLSNYWQNGSKLPAITTLLKNIFKHEREIFCKLILTIVERAMEYRNNKDDPLKKEEIKELNTLLKQLEFKIPELWDPDFLNSLPSDPKEKSTDNRKNKKQNKKQLKKLKQELFELEKEDPQKRGLKFEDFLNDLFKYFQLDPKSSFRVNKKGEQIDGSFQYNNEIYLVEAKWWKKPIGIKELAGFKMKVQGKASWSRGLFISYNGFTKQGLKSLNNKGATNIICMDGQDLYFILNDEISLKKVIDSKVRMAAETGKIYYPVFEIKS